MGRIKRYFKTQSEARKYLANLRANSHNVDDPYDYWDIRKQPKGTRHHGMYYIGSYIEWLNFAD